jgi:threonine/homoserine/homoserine lactone efflux protein
MPIHLLAFVTTIALLAMLPGANNAAITRQTLLGGRRAGLLTVAGSSTGILIWAITAAVGLSAVLLANPHTYFAIRIAGAVVLCVLGLLALLRKPPASSRSRDTATSFVVGVATSLGNPKAGVVAVSLIPQFVTAEGPVLVSSIALGAIWALVSGSWFCLYVWIIDKGRPRANRPALQWFMQAATGVTMIALGVTVAVAA